jgi:D-serine deaminase-like pyridoxal phosphate-dependent protein
LGAREEVTDMIGDSMWALDTPALLVDLEALERNIARMATFFKQAGVNWRPHTKGVKVPAIVHQELRAGAIGITCAKLGEAESMASAGVQDILIANQIVGPQKIARLVNLRRRADVMVCVDSIENAEALNLAAGERGVALRVLVEVNIGLNRCGVEPGSSAVALSKSVASMPNLRFSGLMGWEGHLASKPASADKREACEMAAGTLVKTAEGCRAAGLSVGIVSCGGTGTYQYTARVPGITEVEAGGGVLGDLAYRKWGVPHELALSVLATVISRPTPLRVVVDAGRKAMQREVVVPEPKSVAAGGPVRLSAEHADFDLAEPRPDLKIGDKIEFFVGYGDTTVCLHDEMIGVRDGIVEVVWPILGRGKFK